MSAQLVDAGEHEIERWNDRSAEKNRNGEVRLEVESDVDDASSPLNDRLRGGRSETSAAWWGEADLTTSFQSL